MTVIPLAQGQQSWETTLSVHPVRAILYLIAVLFVLLQVIKVRPAQKFDSAQPRSSRYQPRPPQADRRPQTLRTAYFTPLRHIPGPWYAALTNVPLKLATLRGHRLHHIHALHQRHGAVVRIAPAEVDFSSLSAFRAIHRVGGNYVKTPWYGLFRNTIVDDVFSLRDPKAHAARRKLFARPFAKASLRTSWDGVVRAKAASAVRRMKEEARGAGAGEGVDVYKWWTLMTADVVGQVAFGNDFGLVEAGKVRWWR